MFLLFSLPLAGSGSVCQTYSRFTVGFKTKQTPKLSNPVDRERNVGPKEFTVGSRSKVKKVKSP